MDKHGRQQRPPRSPPSRRVDVAASRRPCQDTNERTNERTDRRRESNLVHFSLKMVAIILMNFSDNQLTKFRVFIG